MPRGFSHVAALRSAERILHAPSISQDHVRKTAAQYCCRRRSRRHHLSVDRSRSSSCIWRASPRSGPASPGGGRHRRRPLLGCGSSPSGPATIATFPTAPMRPAGPSSSFSRRSRKSTAQKSVLWWAANHRAPPPPFRHRARRSFAPPDGLRLQSCRLDLLPRPGTTIVKIADFARYPELMWLHRYEQLPAFVLAVICFRRRLAGADRRLLLEHRAVYHGTFMHQFARPRAASGATSPATIPATIGCSPSSPWARAGTTIITPTRAARARASTGGK